MSKKSIYVIAVIVLIFTACKNEQKTEDHQESESTEMHDNSDGHHDNDKKHAEENRNIEDSSDKKFGNFNND